MSLLEKKESLNDTNGFPDVFLLSLFLYICSKVEYFKMFVILKKNVNSITHLTTQCYKKQKSAFLVKNRFDIHRSLIYIDSFSFYHLSLFLSVSVKQLSWSFLHLLQCILFLSVCACYSKQGISNQTKASCVPFICTFLCHL